MSRVCIIGLGKMGRNHLRVLQELGHEVDTVDLPGRATYAVPHSPGFKLVANPPRPDATVIATPIDSLAGFAKHSLQHGPVLVEKPGASDLIELRSLHDEAKRQGQRLIVGYVERHNPAVQALKENLHRVGEIKHISARRLGYAFDRAGDPALDLATHDLDVLDYLGFSLTLDHVARTEHHVSAHLHDGETTMSIEASHLHPNKQRSITIVGDKSVLHVLLQEQSLWHTTADGTIHQLHVDKAEPLKREWQAFFNGERSDGIAAMTIAEQMVEATSFRIAA
jgi:UDP-N-acetylglucosamine 3-dehydrogenase